MPCFLAADKDVADDLEVFKSGVQKMIE